MEKNLSFEIRLSKIAGKGVFATRKIKKGERICFMLGDELHSDEVDKKINSGIEVVGDPFQISDDFFIDLEEPFRTINHSCSPNAFIRGKNELVALRDINEDEEITYDYSLIMWEADDGEQWTCECKCGLANCRKVIEQFYKLPREKQKKHIKEKTLPDFILEKVGRS